MEIFARRLLAVAATTAVVGVPAVAFTATGGAASATATSSTPRAALPCRLVGRTVTPDLFGIPLPIVDSLLSSVAEPTGTASDSASVDLTDLDSVVAELGSILATAPADVVESVTEEINGALADSLLPSELTTLLPSELTSLLPSDLPVSSITDPSALGSLLAGIFPSGLPTELTDLLTTLPTSPTDLASTLTGLFPSGVPSDILGVLPSEITTLLPLPVASSTSATSGPAAPATSESSVPDAPATSKSSAIGTDSRSASTSASASTPPDMGNCAAGGNAGNGALAIATRPRLAAAARIHVGQVDKVKPGSTSPAATSVSYHWLRGKKAIKHATKKKYKLTLKDAGKRVSVRLTYHRAGYADLAYTLKVVNKVKR